jgi:heme exporter protein C
MKSASHDPSDPPEAGADTRPIWMSLLGVSSLVLMVGLAILGLFVNKPDINQRDYGRLIYIHPAVANTMYIAVGVALVAGLLWLLPRTRKPFWDQLMGAATELATLFCILTLATGAIWGRPVWGAWWVWDPRLTTTAILFVLLVGVLALRQAPSTLEARARRSVVALAVTAANIPIVHFSVTWWRSQHQAPSLLDARKLLAPEVHGLQLFTMLLSFLAFALVFAWLVVMRTRVARWESDAVGGGLDAAIAARRAEAAGASVGTSGGPSAGTSTGISTGTSMRTTP